jgi:redox-sensitive bicupin YhaK (pirin superfamily)
MPLGDENRLMWGFQLWANLPARQKMMPPRYRDIEKSRIPQLRLENGVRINVICGRVDGVRGPVEDIVIDPMYLDIEIPPGSEHVQAVRPEHTVIVYVISGSGYFDKERDPLTGKESLVLFGPGTQLTVSTDSAPLRMLLIAGHPIGEPVAWRGPIVMNTQEELATAFEEYRNGTFLKHE